MKSFEDISRFFMRWKKNQPMRTDDGYHTLIIMSSASGKKIFQWCFPPFLWWLSLIVAGATLFWIGAGTWSAYQNRKMGIQSSRLEKENQLARNELEKQKKEIEFLHGRLKNIQDQAVYIQNYLGLNSNGTGKGKVGQGGGGDFPAQSSPESFSSSLIPKRILPALPGSSHTVQFSHNTIEQLDTDLENIIKTLEKRQYELEHTPSISPVDPQKSWVSCGYGMRVSPFTGKKQFHAGIDIAGWKGTPIIAPANGIVYFAGKWGSMGLTLKIKHGELYMTTYGHLHKAAVKKGQYVKRGDIIGYIGNSGRSTGCHLHYEIKENGKRINPVAFMVDWPGTRPVLAAGERDMF